MPHDFRQDSTLLHLFVRNAIKPLVIGVYDHEQLGPQRVRINVDVWVRMPETLEASLENTFNYEHLMAAIEGAVQGAPYTLQETLLQEIKDRLVAHPEVLHAHIQTEKLDVYPDAQGVGIGVWYHRYPD